YFTSAGAPTYPIPPISFYNIKLKLSLIGSYFPANSTKPIPLAIVLLNSR
ncbi:cyp-like protein, partial [Sodiomyces alkalinus F11]